MVKNNLLLGLSSNSSSLIIFVELSFLELVLLNDFIAVIFFIISVTAFLSYYQEFICSRPVLSPKGGNLSFLLLQLLLNIMDGIYQCDILAWCVFL